MLNYALIAGGVFAVALGGWRVAHSEAPKVEWTQPPVVVDDFKYRAVDGMWSASNWWDRGRIEFDDDTFENPDAENYWERNWLGSQVEIRAKPYWAKQIVPRTWVYVEFRFPQPEGISLYHVEHGEKRYYQAKEPLGAVITVEETEFVIPVSRQKRTHLPFAKPNWSKREYRQTQRWTLRRSGIDAGGGITLREDDARKFVDILRAKSSSEKVKIKVKYYQRDRDLKERRPDWFGSDTAHEFTITAPPESIWAAFPELTYWPWQGDAA